MFCGCGRSVVLHTYIHVHKSCNLFPIAVQEIIGAKGGKNKPALEGL